jgi:hypothetical protein
MLDGMSTLAPWIPPETPDLALLAMEAADQAGVTRLRAWPEVRQNGIAFGDELPTFLCWRGQVDGREHLVLLQVREVGALVPEAQVDLLPVRWLLDLAFEDLARPLAIHPAFPGGASVHAIQILGPTLYRVRTHGQAAPQLIDQVLERLTDIPDWHPEA